MAEADRDIPVPGTEHEGDGIARSEADLRRYETVEELLRDKLSEAIGGWRGAIESALPVVAVVDRGGEAMPPRELLPLRLPEADGAAQAEQPGTDSGGTDLNPFERGPEITEVR